MTSLNKYLGSLDFSTQMKEMNHLFDSKKAEARITFWGTRIIEVHGYDGSASFWDIAKKVVQAANEHYNAKNSTISQSLEGIDLAKKLSVFMQSTDKEIANSNFFTRFLAWAKDQFEELFGGSVASTAFYITKKEEETQSPILALLWLLSGTEPQNKTQFHPDLANKWEKLGYLLPKSAEPETLRYLRLKSEKLEEDYSEEWGYSWDFLSDDITYTTYQK